VCGVEPVDHVRSGGDEHEERGNGEGDVHGSHDLTVGRTREVFGRSGPAVPRARGGASVPAVPFVLVVPVVKSCSTALRGSGTGHASAAGEVSRAGAIVLTCLRRILRCARHPAKCLAEDETSAGAGVRHALGTSTVLPCAPACREADGTGVPASAFTSTVGPEVGAVREYG
jgi:hypothetical protein